MFDALIKHFKIYKDHLINYRNFKLNILKNVLCRFDEKSQILLLGGNLTIGNDKKPYSEKTSCLTMEKNSKIVVNGNFQFHSGADILIKKDAVLTLGKSWANNNCEIRCGHKINIGDNVMFGRNVKIMDSDFHPIYNENKEIINPSMPVNIGNNAWLAEGCTILKGVTVGNNAIVAAGSVVSKDVPANSIVAGNPARVIRENISGHSGSCIVKTPILGIKCTGCKVCSKICPQGAIEMVKDEFGFEYPKIDKEKCTNCSLCTNTCPELNKKEIANYLQPKVFAAWNKDEQKRLLSTSGGVFSVLAEQFMKDGGYVCGAIYNDKHLVEHIVTNKLEDIERLRQSKYIQSDLKNVFPEIKELLNNKCKVMFVGTPCQVSSLKSYLRKGYKNLYTVDFVCLGVNSPVVYRKYLDSLEEKYSSKIKQVQFKNKDFGWNSFHTKIVFENGKIYYSSRNEDPFYRGFIGKRSLYFRNSCYECSHKDYPRSSDITLADFWGVDKELDCDKGTSLIMINSKRGSALFDSAKNHLDYYKRTLREAEERNLAIHISKPMPAEYKEIKKDINKLDYDDFVLKYLPNKKMAKSAPCDFLIVNFWDSYFNYGACLTAYAMQEILKSFNFTSRHLNIGERTKQKWYKGSFMQKFAQKYLNTTSILNFSECENLAKNVKGVILGSDQVLRPQYIKANMRKYTLDFIPKNVRKIAFAPSFGIDKREFLASEHFNEEVSEYMKMCLTSFDYLSCRETSGKEIYKDIFDLDSDMLLDPVFLVNLTKYFDLMKDSEISVKGKIVTYVLDENKDYDKAYSYLEEKFNSDVIKTERKNKDYKVGDWLKSIKDSKLFITDSFHGACFALIFNTPFICICNKNRGFARFKSIMDLFDIKNNFIDSIDDIYNTDINLEQDFSKINKILNSEKQRCLEIIKKVLIDKYSNNKKANYGKKVLGNYYSDIFKKRKHLYTKYRLLAYFTFGKTKQQYIDLKNNCLESLNVNNFDIIKKKNNEEE